MWGAGLVHCLVGLGGYWAVSWRGGWRLVALSQLPCCCLGLSFSLLWAGFWAHWQWGRGRGRVSKKWGPCLGSRIIHSSQQVFAGIGAMLAPCVGSSSPRKGSLFFWEGLGQSSQAERHATLTSLLLPLLCLLLADPLPGSFAVILKPLCMEPGKKAASQVPAQTHWIETSGDGTWTRVVFLGLAGFQDMELSVLKLRMSWGNWDKLVTWWPTGPHLP